MRALRVKWGLEQDYSQNYRGGSWKIVPATSSATHWGYGTTLEWDAGASQVLVATTDGKLIQVPVNAIVIIEPVE